MNQECCFKFLLERQREGWNILYMPNPGNLGDALIACATIQQFQKYNICWHLIRPGQTHNQNNLYVYAGGGNLTPFYNNCRLFMQELSRIKATLCILPHSCFGVDRDILEYQGNLTIFAREAKTYEYLNTLNQPRLSVKIDHDIALSMDVNDNRLFMPKIFNHLYSAQPNAPTREVYAFRKDCESSNIIPADCISRSIDLSNAWPNSMPAKGFDRFMFDERLIFNCASWFLSFIVHSDIVHTDRLHVGIASCLLGKNTYLYDNIYGKNRAVYDYSLASCKQFKVRLVK